jgi:H+/Cl- antiporter ClcA
MNKSLGTIFWIEAVLGTITGVLTVITLFFPDWVEAISGWDPDQHDGTVEMWIVLSLFVATLVIFALARREWRRAAVSPSA